MANLKTVYPFSVSDNYNLDKVVISNDVAKVALIDNADRPFVADLRAGTDAIVGAAKVGTVENGASIVDGKLDLALTPTGRVKFDFSSNVGASNQYTFRCKFLTPDASQNGGLFSIYDSSGSERFNFYYSGSEEKIKLYYKSGTNPAYSFRSDPLTLINGQEYEMELVLNLDTMKAFLFINGESVIIYNPDITYPYEDFSAGCVIGIGATGSYSSNLSICDFEVFNVAIHSEEFSEEIPRVIDLAYEKEGAIYPKSSVLTDGLAKIVVEKSGDEFGSLLYGVIVSGKQKYFNGESWVDSQEQFNTIEDLNANLSLLDLSSGANVSIITKISSSGYGSPQIHSMDVEFSFYKSYAEGKTTIVYGQLANMDGSPIIGAELTFTKKRKIEFGDTLYLDSPIVVSSDFNGAFEVALIETASTSSTIDIEIKYDGQEKKFKGVTIPDVDAISFTELLP